MLDQLLLLQDSGEVVVEFDLKRRTIRISTPEALDGRPLSATFDECVSIEVEYEPDNDQEEQLPWENSIIDSIDLMPTTRLLCERVRIGFHSGADLDVVFRKLAVSRGDEVLKPD